MTGEYDVDKINALPSYKIMDWYNYILFKNEANAPPPEKKWITPEMAEKLLSKR